MKYSEKKPISTPAASPMTTGAIRRKISAASTPSGAAVEISQIKRAEATAVPAEANHVPARSARSSPFCVTFSLVRTKKEPITENSTPMAAMASGSSAPIKSSPAATPSAIADSTEPTYDSYKSAPMPATSPTLSPTLSAMTAGLRQSSSGMFDSTLPTRSAPTSAAFVKMPPPTRANSAIDEAPMPKVTMLVAMNCASVSPLSITP